MPEPLLDIRPDHLQIVRDILQKHVPQYEVWAFGSRAKWSAKEYSDLDLCIVSDKPLSFSVLGAIGEDFSESDLPWKVDVVDWATTSTSFRKIIERDKVVLKSSKLSDSAEQIVFGKLFAIPQKNGLTRPKKVRGSGLPMVNMGELFAHARIKDIEMDLVPISDSEKAYLLEPGDLLFARQSLVREGSGQCSIFLGNTKPTVFESHLIRCRLNTRIANPEFYFNFFRSSSGRAVMETIIEQGAGASGIRGSDLVKLEVPFPKLPIQTEIAKMLAALDDKIALLRETNATLEAIAQALFKSWFVDFDPVRAKFEGREPEGISLEIAALFPREFENSELGEIPMGWQAMPLADACEINPTRRLTKGKQSPYLEMSALPTQGHRTDTPIPRAFSSGTKFINGDTLLARITPCLENGKTAFIDCLLEDEVGWGSTEYIVLRPKAPLPSYWAYLLSRHEHFRQYAIQAMVGTSGRQRVEVSRLAQYLVAVPDERVSAAFAELVEPLQRSIAANDDAAKSLATLRDTLLPRLMSGKLLVPSGTMPEKELV